MDHTLTEPAASPALPLTGSRIAAIFDLDDTLLSESTGRSIIRYLRSTQTAKGWLRRRDVAAVLGSTLLYHYGAMDVTRLMQVTARSVRGLELSEMWSVVERWFAEVVVKTLAPGALERLAWHREQGHVPVICTASSQFSALPVARHLGIEHSIYTPWRDDGFRMTGTVQLPLAYGAGKVFWMRRWAAANGVSLRDSYFYSDHPSDLPLLEMVAHPGAVNPYPGLERVAAARDWPILHWYENAHR
jgi:HAD superfamily hydrolase (TIGR01490 family)